MYVVETNELLPSHFSNLAVSLHRWLRCMRVGKNRA
jgi:hypothetical protein